MFTWNYQYIQLKIKMHYCGLNDHNELIPVDPYDLFLMCNFEIKITEIELLKLNSEMEYCARQTLGLYTDWWIDYCEA